MKLEPAAREGRKSLGYTSTILPPYIPRRCKRNGVPSKGITWAATTIGLRAGTWSLVTKAWLLMAGR